MKKYLVLLIFAIFAVPISAVIPIRGTDVWYSQYVMLTCILFTCTAIVLWKFNKYLAIFLVWCLVSWVVPSHTNPKAMLLLIQLTLACLASYGISKIEYRQIILKTFIYLVLLQGVYIIVQYLNMDPIFNHINDALRDDTVGLAGSHNQVGNFFAITSPIILSYAGILLPLVIFGLLNATTTTAWVAFIISCWIYLAFKKRIKYMAVFLIVATFFMVIFFGYFETMGNEIIYERVELIKLSIRQVEQEEAIMVDMKNKRAKKIKCNKWFGYGLGNFMSISPYTQQEFMRRPGRFKGEQPRHVYSHAHNDYAEVYFDMGRIGFILLMMIVLNLIYRFATSRKTRILKVSFCCLLAHGICALGVFTVHTATTGMLLPIMLGVFEGEYLQINEEDKKWKNRIWG